MSTKRLFGLTFILVGLACALIGYQQSRPSMGEQMLTGLAHFAGTEVPAALKPDKTVPYTLLVGGLIVAAIGAMLAVSTDGQGAARE